MKQSDKSVVHALVRAVVVVQDDCAFPILVELNVEDKVDADIQDTPKCDNCFPYVQNS